MGYYISNPTVDLTDKFILSFNVDFTKPQLETICYGIDTIARRGTTVTTITSFMDKVNRGIVLDNGTTLLKESSQYESDGTYVWNKKGENRIFDLELKVWKDKVYEEVNDISDYDPEADLDIFADGDKLYKYIPGRYIIDKNGLIKLVYANVKVTSIFSFEKTLVVREEYHVHDHLQDFKGKIRMIITNYGSSISLDKMVGESYESIGTYFFTGTNTGAKVYLGLEGCDAEHLAVTYMNGVLSVGERGLVLTISTSVPNQKVNLGYNLGEWTQDDYGNDFDIAGKINWGDGTEPTTFNGTEGSVDTGTNPLIHTYAVPDEYEIAISGAARWNGFSSIADKKNSIRSCLTGIIISEGDDYPIRAIGPGAFAYCKFLGNVPMGLFDYCTDIKDVSSCFTGCTSLSSIPEELFVYCTEINNFSNCFSGCNGIGIDVPNFWELYPGATGTNCYKNCTRAADYYTIPYEWGGPFREDFGGLILSFTTTEVDQVVDLGHILGSRSNKKEVIGGFVDWRDGSVLCEFGNGDGVDQAKFKHTYHTPGRHTIILGGKVKWSDGLYPFEANDLRPLLTSVVLYNAKRSPIYDIGHYAFAESKLSSVPGDLFENCTEVTDFTGCFKNCTNLRTVPGELFTYSPNASIFDSAFAGCTSFNSIPSDLFRTNTEATSFDSTFMGTDIDSIPHDLFSTNNKATNFGDCFRDCIDVEVIPDDLFDNCPGVTDFSGTFRHTGIYEIPAGLFDNNPEVETFQRCFSDCPNLHTIPDKLFEHCTKVTDFSHTFQNDPNLEAIPGDLFKFTTEVTDFSYCFDGDTGLKSEIPSLWADFDDEIVNGEGCFKGCEQVPNWWNIPESWGGTHKVIGATDPAMVLRIIIEKANQQVDLGPLLGGKSNNNVISNGMLAWTRNYEALLGFRPNEGVTSNIFKHTYKQMGEYDIIISGKLLWSDSREVGKIATNDVRNFIKVVGIEGQHTSPIYDLGTGAFANASKLITIPAILFDNCTTITNFSNTFSNCSSLNGVPNELFTKCIKATNFTSCFENCTSISSLSITLFNQCTLANNFTKCFKHCTGIHGNLPSYWLTYRPATGTDCFKECEPAANYFDVPEEWGGPIKQITGEALTLKIHTNAANETVDLGYCLDGTGVQEGMDGGVIDWGDGSYRVGFHNGEGPTSARLRHTYTNSGDHTIIVSGKIKWGNNHNTLASNDVRKVLLEVNVPDGKTSPIYELGDYAFYCANKLTTVSDKLFSTCKTVSFIGAFEGCALLASVPDTLLTNCKARITNVGRLFKGCRSLTHIPATFFNGKTALTHAVATFYYSGLLDIPENLFSSCTWLSDISYCFGCCEITQIPSTLFDNCSHLTNCNHCFCEEDNGLKSTRHLLSIPEDLFDKEVNPEIENFTECFKGCSGITSLAPELWKSYKDSESHSNCFLGCEHCRNWHEIPEAWGGPKLIITDEVMSLFFITTEQNQEVDLGYVLGGSSSNPAIGMSVIAWDDSSELVAFIPGEGIENNKFKHVYAEPGEHEIKLSGKFVWGSADPNQQYYIETTAHAPNDIRKILTRITIASGKTSPIYDLTRYAFFYSTKLTTIPENLFEKCTGVQLFGHCFDGCSSLAQIPEGLFTHSTAATNFYAAFKGCTSLTQIPGDLFSQCPHVTNYGMVFDGCNKLATIPENLFSNGGEVTMFECAFRWTAITEIPANLFSACRNVDDFSWCFYGCEQLQNIPATLFTNNSFASQYSYCFQRCTSLRSIPDTLFDPCTNASNFSYCFYEDTGLTDQVANIWDSHRHAYGESCFGKCTNIENYEDIPGEWGGPKRVITDEAITFSVLISQVGEIVDLAAILATNSTNPLVTGGVIDWGDGYYKVGFKNGESPDLPKFKHAYDGTGNYHITLSGKFKWGDGTQPTGNDVRLNSTFSITIPSGKTSPIYDVGDYAFAKTSALHIIPTGLFDKCTEVTAFNHTFDGSGIAYGSSIPASLFAKSTKATSFAYCFANCTGAFSIPSELFANNLLINDLTGCFNNCTKINGVVPELWKTYSGASHTSCFCGCNTATNYYDVITAGWGCVEEGIMRLTVNTTSDNKDINLGYNLGYFTGTNHGFTNKAYLDWGDNSTPVMITDSMGINHASLKHTYSTAGNHTITIAGIIKWNYGYKTGTEVTQTADGIHNFLTAIDIPTGHKSPIYDISTHAFYNCARLTKIPSNLFDNCTKTTDFSNCFYYCTTLASIPAHLFDKCTAAINFSWTFDHCTTITSIPNGLFDKNINAATFHSVFAICTRLATIPEKLFDYNTEVHAFSYAFNGCTALKSIPTTLFAKNTKVTTFGYCFQQCTALTAIPSTLFQTNTVVTDFSYTFYKCTNIKGNLPTLWTSTKVTAYTNCYEQCYNASNYRAAVTHKYASWPTNCLVLTVVAPGTASLELPLEKYNSESWTIYWGDGTKNTNVKAHTYTNGTSTYDIIITGSAKWRSSTFIIVWDATEDLNSKELRDSLTTVEVYGKCPIRVWAKNAFQSSNKLKSVTTGLFNNVVWSSDKGAIHNTGNVYESPNSKVWDFGGFFYWCTELASIPETLFSDTSSAVKGTIQGLDFDNTFNSCNKLKTIPAKLFSGLPSVNWLSENDGYIYFIGTFQYCTGFTDIPSGLLSNLQTSAVQAYNFMSMFNSCKNLVSIPTGLLGNVPPLGGSYFSVTPINISAMFQFCTSLKNIPLDIITKIPNTIKVDISWMFNGCTGITGTLPTVWTTHNTTRHHEYFYSNCTNASNWNNVPTGWK